MNILENFNAEENQDILNDPKMIELIAAIIEDMFRPSETTSVNAHDAVEDRC